MGKFVAWCAIIFGLLVLWGTADDVAVRPQRLAEMAKMKAKLDGMPSIPDEKVPIAFRGFMRNLDRNMREHVDDYPRASLQRIILCFVAGTTILAFGLWSLQVHRHLPKRPKVNRVW